MKKIIWGTIAGIMMVVGIAGTMWAGADFWYSYCAEETIHETSQDDSIEKAFKKAVLAFNQGTLAIKQQRASWLEQRIYEMEREFGCPNCSGTIKITYNKYVNEYRILQQQIAKLMSN
jgi:hypothetical protein